MEEHTQHFLFPIRVRKKRRLRKKGGRKKKDGSFSSRSLLSSSLSFESGVQITPTVDMGGEKGEQEREGEEEKFHELSAREKGIKRSEDVVESKKSFFKENS